MLTLCNPMDCSILGSSVLQSPRVCSNSCLLTHGCCLSISSSTFPFYFCLQSFPWSGSFPMSQHFLTGGRSNYYYYFIFWSDCPWVCNTHLQLTLAHFWKTLHLRPCYHSFHFTEVYITKYTFVIILKLLSFRLTSFYFTFTYTFLMLSLSFFLNKALVFYLSLVFLMSCF